MGRRGGYGSGGKGRLYTYCYTVTTRMISALRRAATRAIVMFRNCEGKSHKQDTIHLEGEITLAEASLALKNMKNYKSPGSDGFTADFF